MGNKVTNCPNCNTCFCTGASLMRAKDDRLCCSKCIALVNQEINQWLLVNPTKTIRDLKFQNRGK